MTPSVAIEIKERAYLLWIASHKFRLNPHTNCFPAYPSTYFKQLQSKRPKQTIMLSVSSPLLRRPQRSIRRRHRSEGNECGSPSFSPRHLLFVGIFLVSACFSTPCSSFQIALQSQRHQHWRQKKNRPAFNDKNAKVQETRTPASSILRSTGKNDESFSLSSAHKHIVSGESLSQSSDANTNLSFDDVAESPAPPLNYKKYLTMQVGSS